MRAMASQITSLTIVYSSIYWGTDQRKHQSSASLAFVRGIYQSTMVKCAVHCNLCIIIIIINVVIVISIAPINLTIIIIIIVIITLLKYVYMYQHLYSKINNDIMIHSSIRELCMMKQTDVALNEWISCVLTIHIDPTLPHKLLQWIPLLDDPSRGTNVDS